MPFSGVLSSLDHSRCCFTLTSTPTCLKTAVVMCVFCQLCSGSMKMHKDISIKVLLPAIPRRKMFQCSQKRPSLDSGSTAIISTIRWRGRTFWNGQRSWTFQGSVCRESLVLCVWRVCSLLVMSSGPGMNWNLNQISRVYTYSFVNTPFECKLKIPKMS